MRRLLVLALVLFTACGGDGALDPVQTVDGNWNGEGARTNLALTLTQADTLVGGSALIGAEGLAGAVSATVIGVFKYPNLTLTITPLTNFTPFTLTGVMSPTEARLDIVLQGSGLDGRSFSIKKT
jgi:hypothetical protein